VVPLVDARGVVHGVVATAHGPVQRPTEEA